MVTDKQGSWEGLVTDLDQANGPGVFFEKVEELFLDYHVQDLKAGTMFLRERGAYEIEEDEC
jgi:hypothetical protein